MGLFKDFGNEFVMIDLGKGRQIKIPKLNLGVLQENFPQIT
jgi:hypothetical protein